MATIDLTTIKRPFDGTLETAAGGHLPLPADVHDEFVSAVRGPCYPTKHYYVLQTNQLGELQLHPCGCYAVFIYSVIYGWVEVKRGSPLRARIEEIGRLAMMQEGERQ